MTTRRAFVTMVLAAAAAAAAAGCGVKDRTVARLDFADAKLTIDQADGVHHELALDGKGAVAWDGKPFLTITSNGALKLGGNVVARIDKHGAVTIKGQPTNYVIRPNGSFEIDGVAELAIDRDGRVGGPLLESLDHPAMNLEGAKLAYVGPPAARWATLIGFAALLTPDLSPAELSLPAPTGAPPAPAPTPPAPPAAPAAP